MDNLFREVGDDEPAFVQWCMDCGHARGDIDDSRWAVVKWEYLFFMPWKMRKRWLKMHEASDEVCDEKGRHLDNRILEICELLDCQDASVGDFAVDEKKRSGAPTRDGR